MALLTCRKHSALSGKLMALAVMMLSAITNMSLSISVSIISVPGLAGPSVYNKSIDKFSQ